jgi:hypothetical protein
MSFQDFLNEINPRRKSGFLGSITNEITQSGIVKSFGNTLTNSFSFMNKFSGNIQNGLLDLTSGTTLYLIIGLGGVGVLAYAYSSINKK